MLRRGEWAEALLAAKQLVSADPRDAYAWAAMGRALRDGLHDPETAYLAYCRALEAAGSSSSSSSDSGGGRAGGGSGLLRPPNSAGTCGAAVVSSGDNAGAVCAFLVCGFLHRVAGCCLPEPPQATCSSAGCGAAASLQWRCLVIAECGMCALPQMCRR